MAARSIRPARATPAPCPPSPRPRLEPLRARRADAARAAVAAGVFAREWARGPRGGFLRALGRALVRLCTDLGATFIKVGQIASTRADLLPRPSSQELATLRDQVPPFPFADVRATIGRTSAARSSALRRFDPGR